MDKSNNYCFITFINSELFPKSEYKDVPIIQVTEHFAQNFYIVNILNNPKPTASLVKLRRILYGLACTSFIEKKTVEIINTIQDKNPQEILLLLGELKLEWKKLSEKSNYLTSEELLKEGFYSIDKWSNLLKNYYPAILKNSLDNLSVSEEESLQKSEEVRIDSPQKIKSRLEEYFVGSDDVKTTLSRIFYEHYLAVNLTGKQILPKRNLLLVGPSGSGKSYVIQKLSEISSFPFLIYDSSKLTQRGIVGDKVEDTLRLLYNKTKSIEKMNGGVIFFDEIDKLAKGAYTAESDVSTIGPQQDLLKFIEGDDYEFSASNDRYAKPDLKFNSSKLLIIAGGAFEGIEDVIKQRSKHFGFNANNKNKDYDAISIDDLINFGIIKQLAARFQIISVLQQKTVEHLIDILKNVKDSILKIYIDYFRFHGCELSFTDSGIRKIAELAQEQNIGARGLVKIIEQILPMYELGNRTITNLVVDEKYTLAKSHESLAGHNSFN